MGMDLYAASPLARRIWNTADAFLLERYGFSILQIVRDNPKSIELTFGGTRGEAMRANYKALHQEVTVRQADGSMASENRPLFPDITDLSSTYSFSHPEGLLFATQFSQPALVLFELAAFEDMRERSLVPEDCYFAGHSLGEYAALASVAAVLSIEALVEIVFLRGITMQNAVQRDSLGRSQYAMVAVNPARVHPTRFREPQLQQVIAAIVAVRPELLQVVNYNVDNYQYVVAGERGNLRALSYILDEIRKDPAGASSRMEAIAKGALQAVADARDPESGWIELERGTATIPLPGIDVPFHSRFLANGVPAFRQILTQRVAVASIDERKLVGRYIPNVTAAPFSLSKEYVTQVQKDTQSPELAAVLEKFDTYAAKPQQLAHALVLVRHSHTCILFLFRDLLTPRLGTARVSVCIASALD
jgi:fatty acid synthase subunit beta